MFKSNELSNMNKKEQIADFEEHYAEFDIDMLIEYLEARKSGIIDNDFYKYYSGIELYSGNFTTSQFYKYTNENLAKLFNSIDIKGKKVATVGSSGDQVINAIYYGASEIDVIDLNFFTKVFTELKIASVKALSNYEFIEFFNQFPNNFNKYYSTISHHLPDRIKFFYDTLILNGDDEILKYFVHMPNSKGLDHLGSEIFSDELKYNELKGILFNGNYRVNYKFGELMDFPQKLNGRYDLILLSNIIDYYHKIPFTDKNINQFIEVVDKLYKNNLNKNGLIQLSSQPGRHIEDFECLRKYIESNNYRAFFIPSAGMWNQTLQNATPSYMLQKVDESQSGNEKV